MTPRTDATVPSPPRQFRRTHPRRGFTMILALCLLVFIAAALLAITARFSNDARRTRLALADAQSRQLLLAAQQFAAEALAQHEDGRLPSRALDHRASGNDDRSFSIRLAPLPPEASATGAHAVVLATAVMDDRTAEQRLTYRRQAGRWVLVHATITRAR